MNKICSFGDSVMKGIVEDCSRVAGSVKYMISNLSFAEICSSRLGLDIRNYARFGGTINQGMDLVEKHKDDVSDSRYCVIEYGGNDCSYHWDEISQDPVSVHNPLTMLGDFRRQYSAMIDRICKNGAKPVLLSLPLIDSERYFNHITKGLNPENILKCKGVPVIDITSPFLVRKDYRDYLCSDGIHPNEEGHRIIADAICDYVNTNKNFRI